MVDLQVMMPQAYTLMPRLSTDASGWAASKIEDVRPVRQRLVRTHADGRKSLFLSSHAGAIVGWSIPEARSFLRDRTEVRDMRRTTLAGEGPTVEQVG